MFRRGILLLLSLVVIFSIPLFAEDVEIEGYESDVQSSCSNGQSNLNSLYAVHSPYALGIIDFYNGHDVEGSDPILYSPYGTTVGIGYSRRIRSYLSFDSEASYSLIINNKTVIPSAYDIHYGSLHSGLSLHASSEAVDFGFGLFAGASLAVNSSSADISFSFGSSLSIDFPLTESFSIGLRSRVVMMHMGDKKPMYRAMTYLVEPLALTASWRF